MENERKAIKEDLIDTFYDAFSEMHITIEEMDLSDTTIEKLQQILKKDMNICMQQILKNYLPTYMIQEFLKEIDKLIYEMRQNGSQYWANRLEKLKEKEEEE